MRTQLFERDGRGDSSVSSTGRVERDQQREDAHRLEIAPGGVAGRDAFSYRHVAEREMVFTEPPHRIAQCDLIVVEAEIHWVSVPFSESGLLGH